MSTPFLEPGRNCWRVERTDAAAFLIDGAAYFSAVRRALAKARHSILILGWDIDSRMVLTPLERPDDLPSRLGEFLNALVSRTPDLHAHVLVWDFAMLYALDREWLPIFKLGWQTHKHLHFRMDGHHPTGASHHQKIVVVDDAVAFVGGMDLSKWRWDTPAHAPQESGRLDPEGTPYPPVHDVQVLVAGAPARALGELARERWYRATGERIPPPGPVTYTSVWPEGLERALVQAPVGIARTEPLYGGLPLVNEVERLYLDTIARAERWVYVENQYFTSQRLVQAIAERLRSPESPEFVMVLPEQKDGWLEHHTMDVLRARALRQLREADRHGRFRAYHPVIPKMKPRRIDVHAKVMVMDDRLARVGSANLANRSMRLDTECDLALIAETPSQARAVREFRGRLLAEHLGVDEGLIERTLTEENSLIGTIERLRSKKRTLQPLHPTVPDQEDLWGAHIDVIDPEQPMEPQYLISRLLGEEERKPARRQLVRGIAVLAIITLLALAWRYTPLSEWLDMGTLQALFVSIKEIPASPLIVLGAYVLGGLLVVPLTLLLVLTILTFGPVLGFIYALLGSVASAVATYAIGHHLGSEAVRRFAGSAVNRLSQRLARQGILTVIILRMLPVAPFTVVNVVAGASHISFRDFTLGTVLGMVPGLIAITIFIDSLAEALRNPELGNIAVLAGVVLVIAAGAFLLRKWLLGREAEESQA